MSSSVISIRRSSARTLPRIMPKTRPMMPPIARPPKALANVSRVARSNEPSASAPTKATMTSLGGATLSLGPPARAPISARMTSAKGRTKTRQSSLIARRS
jgi:hypothetical protein